MELTATVAIDIDKRKRKKSRKKIEYQLQVKDSKSLSWIELKSNAAECYFIFQRFVSQLNQSNWIEEEDGNRENKTWKNIYPKVSFEWCKMRMKRRMKRTKSKRL